ncbi:MAG: YdeI/OmpD-associated family protein [Planctomycetota bacterium]
MAKQDDFEHVEVTSRAGWRAWLEANHTQAESIWLVTYKKAAGEKYVPFGDIVEEAICFGWIDSRVGKVDALRSRCIVAPRRTASAWSAVNKKIVAKMTKAGLMQPAGLAKIAAAKKNGMWTFLDDVEAGVIPDDLAVAFRKHRGARSNFDAFPRSTRRATLEWIKTAKKTETRAKRIAETAAKSAQNQRPR